MNAALRRVEDRDLVDALASVVGQIRESLYTGIVNEVLEVLRTKAGGFISKLADHLRQEEEHLYPELRRLRPTCFPDIHELLLEHVLMRNLAREMSVAIVGRDNKRALEISRTFLATLLAHMERESRLVTGILKALSTADAARLAETLDHAEYEGR